MKEVFSLKITIDVLKDRLKLISELESAAVACTFEADGQTINLNENVYIALSTVDSFLPFKLSDAEYEELDETATVWKETLFPDNDQVFVIPLNTPITGDIGILIKLNLYREPDMILTTDDLAKRLQKVDYIKNAWIICDVGNPEEYINYSYDVGVYFKLTHEIEDEELSKIRKEIYTILLILFGNRRGDHFIEFLAADETEIEYKWMTKTLEEMTLIL